MYSIGTMSGDSEFTSEFFDTASAAWMDNKRKRPNGCYVYTCMYTHNDGALCNKTVTLHDKMVCWKHRGRTVAVASAPSPSPSSPTT